MKFTTITPSEFTKFANHSPYKTFLQTEEIAELRQKNGWTAYYFGVKKDEKIIATAMAVAKPTFLGKSTFFIPGGPLLDYEDKTLVNFFLKNLIKYCKTHNGYLLHIEPNYIKTERNREGEIFPDGVNHEKAVNNLTTLGFKNTNSDNPIYQFVLNLNNQKETTLFASFKQNTRNLISRAERKGVKIRELGRDELVKFKHITEETSKRRHFADKTLDYYETMYDLFGKKDEVKFVVAEVEKKILASAMFITYGDEVIYLFSGSDEKYMKEYNAQYAIQWYMIKYALKNKFKRYNFYGIQGLPDPKKPGYGIYKFKKGFATEENGRVIELVGAYEYPVNLPFYYLHKILSNIRHKNK